MHACVRMQFDEAKRDVDIAMHTFLHEEVAGKEAIAGFQISYKEVAALELELTALRREEAERSAVLRELASQRDRVALAIAQKLAKVKDVAAGARIKEMELQDLHKTRRHVARRIRDFEKLYDLVKNQRNKFVNLIQAAGQSTTEMRDKLKVLANELNILHSEVVNKDKLLGQSRSQASAAVAERDQLRVELGRLGVTFRDRQTTVDEQVRWAGGEGEGGWRGRRRWGGGWREGKGGGGEGGREGKGVAGRGDAAKVFTATGWRCHSTQSTLLPCGLLTATAAWLHICTVLCTLRQLP